MSIIKRQQDLYKIFGDTIKLAHVVNNPDIIKLGAGPALVGVAVTNNPHLPLPEIKVITDDTGNELVRIPILRTGVFSYKGKKLKFTPGVFHKIVNNHNSGKLDYMPSINTNHKRGKALGWFHGEKGKLAVEDNLLVGYTKPTSPEALEMFKNGEYAYASAEIYPDYKSTAMSISMSDVTRLGDETMALDYTEEDGVYQFTQEQLDAVVALQDDNDSLKTNLEESKNKLQELETKLEEANDKIVKLEALVPEPENTLEIPQEVKIQLESQAEEIRRLQQAARKERIDRIISEAAQPVEGKTHPAFVLEFARSILTGSPIGEGDSVIKLEKNDVNSVTSYVSDAVIYLLENLDRSVSVEKNTPNEDKRPLNQNEDNPFKLEGEYTDEDYQSLWALVD